MVLYLFCFVKWPDLPADVRTVAGAAWYLSEADTQADYRDPQYVEPSSGREVSLPMLDKNGSSGQGSYTFGNYIDKAGMQRVGVRWVQRRGPARV